MTEIRFNRWGATREAAAHYAALIDEAAADAWRRFLPEPTLAEEYRLVTIEARQWVERAKVGGPPEVVLAHADAAGMTAEQAVDEILGRATEHEEMLRSIRRIRLGTKARMARAATPREVRVIYDVGRQALDLIIPTG